MDDNDELEIELDSSNESVDINEENYVYVNIPEGVIDELEAEIALRALITEAGAQIALEINNNTYVLTAKLKDKNGNVIYTSNGIDLPIESMIINGEYDEETKKLILTLQNGQTIEISLADLISGLVSEDDLATALESYYTKLETYSKTETDSLIDDVDSRVNRLYNSLPKGHETGTNIDINDSADLPLNDFNAKGDTTQKTTEGNQLIDIENPNGTLGSPTYSFTNDILTVGNDTANTYVSIRYNVLDLLNKNHGKKLYFVYDTIDISNQYGTVAQLNLQYNDGTANRYITMLNHSLTKISFTIPDITSNISSAQFYIYSNNTSTSQTSSLIISKPMLQFGTEEKAYEKYTGGIASPNTSYPQAINSVGDNVNMLNISYYQQGSIDETTGEDSSVSTNARGENYIAVEPNTIYTLSANAVCSYIRLSEYAADKSHIQRDLESNSKFITIKTTANTYYLRWSLNYNGRTMTEEIVQSLNLKLEKQPQSTSYSPYNMGSIAIEKCNKNLFNINLTRYNRYSTTTISGNSITLQASHEDTNGYVWWNIPIVSGQNYTISYGNMVETVEKDNNKVYCYFSDSPISTYSSSQLVNGVDKADKSITLTSTAKYLVLTLRVSNGNSFTISDIQVEKNNAKTTYVAHASQTYPIYIQSPMRAIGDIRDDFIKQNGVWYERHKILRKLFNGTETWGVNKTGTENYYYYTSFTTKANTENTVRSKLKCNRYLYSQITSTGTANGIWITSSDVRIRYGTEDTPENFETWLSSNNVYMDYAMTEENWTLTQCTNDQVAQLEEIINDGTYQGETHYSSEDEVQAVLDITYYKDLTQTLANIEARLALLE